MKFLKRLSKVLLGWFQAQTEPVNGTKLKDPLARYLMHKRFFSREKGIVKGAAFMPSSKLQTSVFEVGGMAESDIWTSADETLRLEPGEKIYGRGDFSSHVVVELGLEVEADFPPARHHNLVGWPVEKPKQKLIALKLAEKAKFIPRHDVS